MTYEQIIDYLYHAAPLFQNIGAGAYKEGLDNTLALDEHFNHTHRHYRTIHVAGTNGKGSVSHTLAAILQQAGLRVGLYTSPHLKDFRERIRVNGKMIPKERVIEFVEQERSFFEPLSPSFFELTTALAFKYFAECEVDVAVIEVGLGGRLDCTNIITPDLSVITNISMDHTQLLGNTLAAIAREKAGIIKACLPVVVGETGGNIDVRDVFMRRAKDVAAPIRFADEEPWVVQSAPDSDGGREYALFGGTRLKAQLGGACQRHNTSTILCAIDVLMQQDYYSDVLLRHPQALREGFADVSGITGLQGRWQRLHDKPLAVCDVGHNIAGIQYVTEQLLQQSCKRIRIVFGMVDDKDYRGALKLLTDIVKQRGADFYLTQPSSARALPVTTLAQAAQELFPANADFSITQHTSVYDAYLTALNDADSDDFVFVGGSCYVVADLLSALDTAI